MSETAPKCSLHDEDKILKDFGEGRKEWMCKKCTKLGGMLIKATCSDIVREVWFGDNLPSFKQRLMGCSSRMAIVASMPGDSPKVEIGSIVSSGKLSGQD